MKHIVIVEDDIDDREFLTDAFSSVGDVYLTSFPDSIKMLKVLNERAVPYNVDAVIIDFHLHLNTGCDVLIELKNDERTTHLL